MMMIRFYMSHGHYGADLDPLGLNKLKLDVATSQYSHSTNDQKLQLEIEYFGFT